MCGGSNSLFNAFLYLEPVQRFENKARIRGSGSYNSSTSCDWLGEVKVDR